jgi:colanic acid biosynthesis glycosyl transferase WcaI
MNLAALRLSKVPIVCAVKDIYPESLIDKGMLNPRGVLANGLMHLNRLMLRRCDRIVTLSPGMADLLVRTRRLRPSRVIVVPNWVDAASYPSIPATESVFRREHGIPEDAFVAMFAGSLTLSSGAMLYVEVAQALESYRDLQIVLVGDGSLRDSLARAVAARRLTNIRLISPLLPADVPAVQASADVLLLSLAGGMSHSAAPSKQVAYLFSGRPILANVPGDSYAAQIIRDAECGEIVPPNDHQATAAVLLRLSRERASLLGMGLRARKLAEATFSRSLVLPKLVRLIEMVGTRQVRR